MLKRVQNSSVQSRSSSFLAATTRSTCSPCRNLLSDLSNSRRNPSKSRQRLAHRPQAFLVCGGAISVTWGVCGRGFLQPYSVERCNHQHFVAHGISILIAPDEDKCCRFARRATLRHCIRCVPAFDTNLSLVQGPPPVVRLRGQHLCFQTEV